MPSDNGLPTSLRPGRYYSDAELASAAAAILGRLDVTQTAAADALGLEKPNSVSMALALVPDPESDNGRPFVLRYANRGHAIRREILRRWGGFDLSGEKRPTHTRVNLPPE